MANNWISIHALREEGDIAAQITGENTNDISIHALREEGDGNIMAVSARKRLFLSTPSARRATAKTEKNISAFVSL